MQPSDFIMMPIPASSYTAVCALLSGAATSAIGVAQNVKTPPAKNPTSAETGNANSQSTASEASGDSAAPTATAEANAPSSDAGATATGDPNEVDAHGWPWSSELHASTQTKTKDGLWRMKVGVTRPDPKPGFPKSDATPGTGTAPETPTSTATSQTATAPESAPPATTSDSGDEDEFAAFRAAAAASTATDQAAAASVPAREYSDADLGMLCNQAAVKLGDPAPVREIISRYVPTSQVQHSRNVPADQRTDFVKEVETKAGIEFAG